MKTLVNRIAMFAASAFVLGTIAYGQTQLTAEIPFAFQVSGKTMPAGNYTLTDHSVPSGTHTSVLRNREAGMSALAVSGAFDINSAGNPSLIFACAKTGCALAAVKTIDGTRNFHPSMKVSPRDREALSKVEVPLRAANGE